MVVLDTNVVSELMRPQPNERVVAWCEAQPIDETFITAVTVAEIAHGIALMRNGTRKRQLSEVAGGLFADYLDQTLPFDAESAVFYGPLVAKRDRMGQPISTEDGQIAATCLLHDATLATRNTKDFKETGAKLVNPWTD
jgi:predicted nucleic acid-binding protein